MRTTTTKPARSVLQRLLFLFCVSALCVASLSARQDKDGGKSGLLKLRILDSDTGQPMPARVELLDEQGKAFVADDALPVGGDSRDRETPWKGTPEQAIAELSLRKVNNRYTGTEQFYSGGTSQVMLPPGNYRLRVFRGLEYRVATEKVSVQAGRPTELPVKLARWINLPKQGWYSAESHVHIARPYKEMNAHVSKQMQAEDIHVTNLLQWGLSKRFHNSTQYAHGPEGLYHEGDFWLATGQENPRTHFLGHTITLGARAPINFPDTYLAYNQFWEESRRQNALSGWAHFATTRGGQEGIAIDLLDGLLSFIEVLQFDRASYGVWYDALNLGLRITPIGGTDYMPPGSPYLPGRERFYTRLDGPLTYEKWLEGVRRGRTFVTNGPLLEFEASGKGVGETISLSKPGSVPVKARVRFDPQRDNVERLELVVNGEVVRSFPRPEKATEIVAALDHPVTETCWLAVRASGKKLMEGKSPFTAKSALYQPNSPSAAHSAALYVTVENTPPLRAQRRAKLIAAAWQERLVDLEKRLAEDQLAKLAQWPGADGVDEAFLRKNRALLLERIQLAKKRLGELTR